MKVRFVVGVLALAVIGAVTYGLMNRQRLFNYGKLAAEVARHRATLDREPCDRIAIVRLTDAMLRAGDHRGALVAASQFLSRCGELERLHVVMYTAHQRLSEHDAAIAEASKLIEKRPYEPDFWWWRGRSYAEKGDWQRAYEDHTRVTMLCPDCLAQIDRADALEKIGRPCEGIDSLATVSRLRRDVRRNRIDSRIAVLRARPECRDWAGTGRQVLRLQGAHAYMNVKINGIAIGRAMVDTGASTVAIPRHMAERVGLRGPFLAVQVRTAGGIRQAQATSADLVEAGALRARYVPLVVSDDLTEPLLGMSFLSRFDVSINTSGIEVQERDAAQRGGTR
jgi:clan AA aspartic protease (TIGR02281 family)